MVQFIQAESGTLFNINTFEIIDIEPETRLIPAIDNFWTDQGSEQIKQTPAKSESTGRFELVGYINQKRIVLKVFDNEMIAKDSIDSILDIIRFK